MKKGARSVAIFHCGFIYSGGGERIVLEQALGLIKRGWNVAVYAPTLDARKSFPSLVKEVGVKTFFPSVIDRLPYRNALRMVVASLLAPFLAINFRKIDIFVGANQPGAWIAFCMAKVLRKPYIVYLNQPNRIIYPRPVDRQYGWYSTEKDYHLLYVLLGKMNIVLSKLDWLSINRAQAVLCNGGYIASIIQNVYGKQVLNVPAGAYNQTWAAVQSVDVFNGKVVIGKHTLPKPYFLITNRHDPQKRFDYVIQALGIIKDKTDAILVIPGPATQHTQSLIDSAVSLGLEKRVIFIGKVKENDLQRLYKHACVYCYPSPEEDFGLGPIEAGGWATPTVAWNFAGPTVTVEDGITGFLAQPYDLKDYAHKMLTLILNPKLRNTMGAAAWKRTKKVFSWRNHIDMMERQMLKFTDK